MTTITDVAARAGVSMKTVSRVLNNEAHVRPALRERVLAAMQHLDYRPNLAARQLAANRSFLISLLIYGTSSSYASNLIVAAASECRRHGYHLVSETFDESETGEDVVRRVTTNLRPDGIILPPPLCNDDRILAAIERGGTPLVRLAGTGDHYGQLVEVHDRAVSHDLVAHLISLGHRRIAFVTPAPGHGAAAERTLGYRDALHDAGLPFDPSIVVDGDFSFASGARAFERLAAQSDRPTAIFAANDGMALGAMAAAQHHGLRVPDEIAIAGFDDSPGSRMVFPALTTVRQPIAEMARTAVLALIGRNSALPELRHELIVRGSTTGNRDLVLTEFDG